MAVWPAAESEQLQEAKAGVGAVLFGAAVNRYVYAAPAAEAAEPRNGNVIVAVFMRGGMDGLGVVAPLGDPNYQSMRPGLGLNDETLIPLPGGKFGIHPAMPNMAALIAKNEAAIFHATGHPNKSRSHFEKQRFMEVGAAQATMRSGWLGRYLASTGEMTTFRGLTMGASSAFMLANPSPTLSVSVLKDFSVQAADAATQREVTNKVNATWGAIGGQAQDMIRLTLDGAAKAASYGAIPSTATYPRTLTGQRMADVARMVKAGAGLEAACVDIGGWDMHTNMGDARTKSGGLWSKLTEVDQAFKAFWDDLGPLREKVTVVTMSEFGRTGSTNPGNGTDHGYGSMMMAMGTGLVGGVHGTWPGLDKASLDGGDLNIVNDYRDLAADILRRKMGLSEGQMASVFPDFAPKGTSVFA